MLFELGGIYATPGVNERFTQTDLLDCLKRHAAGDWGDVPAEDAAANNDALTEGGRLVSAYKLGSGTIWIVTEAGRSITTILTPEEC